MCLAAQAGLMQISGMFTHKRALVFVDTETTGTDVINDRVIEVAAIRINPDGTRDEFSTRVNPGVPIPPGASAVNGITDDDVKGCPSFREIAPRLAEILGDAITCGYNVRRFDVPLLSTEFSRVGLAYSPGATDVLDLMEVFALLIPRTLSGAVKLFSGLDHVDVHQAHGDAKVCIDLLNGQMAFAKGALPYDVADLAKMCAPPNSDRWLDPLGKLIRGDDGAPVINFGRNAGTELSAVDSGWLDWFMRDQTFHPVAKTIVRAEQERRHNARQAELAKAFNCVTNKY